MRSNFSFKYPREYIHGTDLLPFALECLSLTSSRDYRLLELRMERFTRFQVDFLMGVELTPSDQVVARGRSLVSGVEVKFCLCESGNEVIGTRPYDEEDVLRSVQELGSNEFSVSDGKYTVIEQTVATMKRFCNSRYSLEDGRWVFTGFRSTQGIDDLSSMRRIAFHQALAKRLVLFKAFNVNGAECAMIEFARKSE